MSHLVQQNTKSKMNFALIFFLIIAALILLANLFDIVPWDIWLRGSILVGIIIFVNILYKILGKKNWVYNFSQILVLIATFALLAHTLFTLTNPNYLQTNSEDLTDLEAYYQNMELRTGAHENIKFKSLNLRIQKGYYILRDSMQDSYYFKMHPPQKLDETVFVAHSKVDSDLRIDFQAIDYKPSYIKNFLKLQPTLLLGTPYMPLKINVKVEQEGNVEINLKDQKIETFEGKFEAGESVLSLSKVSIPRSQFLVTMSGGKLTMILPKELEHNIKYIVKNDAKLFIAEKEILGQGEYKVISEGTKNPCTIRVDLEFGELEILIN